MLDLLFRIESALVNIFQSGLKATQASIIQEVSELSEESHDYGLEYLGTSLKTLSQQMESQRHTAEPFFEDITRNIFLISESVNLLNKKINYDSAGGY